MKGGKEGKQAIFLLPSLYNEALLLLADAHEYFHGHAAHEQESMNRRERTMFACEMSRVTIRLSCIMAWLMARKAVFDGKLTLAEAHHTHRLDCRDVCMNQHIEAESILPDRMTHLLDKSLELYQRVARLDAMPA